MNISMNGKKIKSISWPDTGNDEALGIQSSDKYGELSLSVMWIGDRYEFWIVQVKDGKEVARYNVRYVESIVWEQGEDREHIRY